MLSRKTERCSQTSVSYPLDLLHKRKKVSIAVEMSADQIWFHSTECHSLHASGELLSNEELLSHCPSYEFPRPLTKNHICHERRGACFHLSIVDPEGAKLESNSTHSLSEPRAMCFVSARLVERYSAGGCRHCLNEHGCLQSFMERSTLQNRTVNTSETKRLWRNTFPAAGVSHMFCFCVMQPASLNTKPPTDYLLPHRHRQ